MISVIIVTFLFAYSYVIIARQHTDKWYKIAHSITRPQHWAKLLLFPNFPSYKVYGDTKGLLGKWVQVCLNPIKKMSCQQTSIVNKRPSYRIFNHSACLWACLCAAASATPILTSHLLPFVCGRDETRLWSASRPRIMRQICRLRSASGPVHSPHCWTSTHGSRCLQVTWGKSASTCARGSYDD